MAEQTADWEQLEISIGIRFRDRDLLLRALTHSSYVNEQPNTEETDNERLEYLGDAILDFLMAEHLYHILPDVPEGRLTSLRAALVCRETLARCARRLNLGDYLRMGRGEVESGGRERDATLCAAFEALVGAIYLDQGLEVARTFVIGMLSLELDRLQTAGFVKDAKSRLQEYTQGRFNVTPEYRTVEEHGPDHAKEFTVDVLIDGVAAGRGRGPSKQSAAQEAAAMALHLLLTAEEEGDDRSDLPVARLVADS